MKKTNYKINISLYIFLLGAFLTAILPFGVMAQNPEKLTDKAKRDGQTAICSKIDDFFSRTVKSLSDHDKQFQAKKQDRENNLIIRRKNRDADLEDYRAKWDVNRAEHYIKLGEKATTDGQIQALENFKAAAETAVSIRQKAVDGAVLAFRDGVDKIIADRKAALDVARNNFQTAVNAALQNVQIDCANEANNRLVRQKLQTELKDAKDKLKNEIEALKKPGKEIRALAKARNEAVLKAADDFKDAIEKAKVDFKASYRSAP